jgi:UPF0755 protein
VVTGTVITCLALGIGGAGVYIGKLAYNKLTSKSEADITDFPGPGHSEASITIDEGDPGSRIAEKLVAAGVIATVAPFIKAFNDAGDAAAGIQPGTYRLRLQMSAADALTALMDPASRLAVAFTVAEGKRTDEVYAIVGLALATAQDQPAATGEEV